MVKNTKRVPKYKEISSFDHILHRFFIARQQGFQCSNTLQSCLLKKCDFVHALGMPVPLSHHCMEKFSWLHVVQSLKIVFIVMVIAGFSCTFLIAL